MSGVFIERQGGNIYFADFHTRQNKKKIVPNRYISRVGRKMLQEANSSTKLFTPLLPIAAYHNV